jgi:hypothetical protein
MAAYIPNRIGAYIHHADAKKHGGQTDRRAALHLRKPFLNPLCRQPDFFVVIPQIPNIIGVNASRFIGAPCYLVKV